MDFFSVVRLQNYKLTSKSWLLLSLTLDGLSCFLKRVVIDSLIVVEQIDIVCPYWQKLRLFRMVVRLKNEIRVHNEDRKYKTARI